MIIFLFSGSVKLHANRVSEAYRGSESATANPGFGLGFKDIPASIKLLLTNPTFMALNMAGACEGLFLDSFELHFHKISVCIIPIKP